MKTTSARTKPDAPASRALLEVDEHEPWLISYADMMTLLAGVFVMMFSFASFDQSSAQRMEKALNHAFGADSTQKEIRRIADGVRSAMAMTPYIKDMRLRAVDDGVEVSFGTSSLFESGSARLTPEAERAMRALASRVRDFGENARVRVEGHSDDTPIASAVFPSNWVLSSARAATIVTLFEEARFAPNRLETVGYGSSRPVAPNRDAENRPLPANQALNRRVVVKILVAGEGSGPSPSPSGS